jgi:hypothetical protein
MFKLLFDDTEFDFREGAGASVSTTFVGPRYLDPSEALTLTR